MTRDDLKLILRNMGGTRVEMPSQFLGPSSIHDATLNAVRVFDALRKSCDPPVTEADFNVIANEVDRDLGEWTNLEEWTN